MSRTGTMLRAAYLRFRDWRRSRPFWGGLFVLLGGIEILLPPYLSVHVGDLVLTIQTFGGLSSLLIGVLMIVCALVLWVRPQFRVPAAIAAFLVSLLAIVTSNLGGFLLGTLLGLVGASLAFSWTGQAKEKRRKRDGGQVAPIAVMIGLALAVALIAHPAPARAQPPTSTTSEPTTTTPPATTTTAAPTTTETPAATSTPAATTTTAAPATTTPKPKPTALTVPAGSRVWTLKASKLEMSGLSFLGIVDVLVGGQQLKALDFTATDLKLTNLVQTAQLADGHTMVTSARPGSVSTVHSEHSISLHTLRLQGTVTILGVPVAIDYSADNPPLAVLPSLTLTDVTITNSDLAGGTLIIPGASTVLH